MVLLEKSNLSGIFGNHQFEWYYLPKNLTGELVGIWGLAGEEPWSGDLSSILFYGHPQIYNSMTAHTCDR